MYLIPDITVSLAAMAGLLVVLWYLERCGLRDGLSYRFRYTLILTAVFLGARCVVWLGWGGVFRFATYAAAAALPLMVFLLAEALIRRHAPLWAKLFVATGTGALVMLSLVPQATVAAWFLIPLLTFQLCGFGLAGWLVWTRDMSTLSSIENSRIRRISLSLLVILPFLISDYRIPWAELPVRLSGLAILVTCWLSLSMQASESQRARGASLLWPVAVSGLAALAVAGQFDLPLWSLGQVWAMVLSLVLLFEIGGMAARTGRMARSGQLLSDLAQAAQHPLAAFTTTLRNRAASEGALILSHPELSEFDASLLIAGLGASGRCRLQDLPKQPADDTLAQSQLRLLMARYSAGAVHLVAETPLLLAVQRGGAMGGADLSAELVAAFAMARLISERDAAQKGPS